jgi:hypothetical protein
MMKCIKCSGSGKYLCFGEWGCLGNGYQKCVNCSGKGTAYNGTEYCSYCSESGKKDALIAGPATKDAIHAMAQETKKIIIQV